MLVVPDIMISLWSLRIFTTLWMAACVASMASTSARRLRPRMDADWKPGEYMRLGHPDQVKLANEVYFDELEGWFLKRDGPLPWSKHEQSARVLGSTVNERLPVNGPWLEDPPKSLEELRSIRRQRGIERHYREWPAVLPRGRLHEWQKVANEEYFNALELWFRSEVSTVFLACLSCTRFSGVSRPGLTCVSGTESSWTYLGGS